ncbi:VWA domain-containing protein [Planotetraspora sp. A-T 1434]|uniref:VWA domain-containing protein n=1 Tax=Planotetraspora sp. A-T 1434 TaxID=2979219 RepID=UPI0021BEB2D2|nr:vWA domain-containing protein [Planotetraspora sp. A-T 1434]MCT9929856.1 VWA domain-containing protein [Planotetraspora sp. A-T 1434]
MRGGLAFHLDVRQGKHLFTARTELHASLEVSAEGSGTGPAETPAARWAEVLVIDCSGSMGEPAHAGGGARGSRPKIADARRATAAAIDVLPDGVLFAVVEGTHEARVVYPYEPRMAVATPETRAQAKDAVARLVDGGGTHIGTWLTQALDLFAAHPSEIRHVILLTDGQNMESSGALDQALKRCEGQFACDARGIGEGWDADQLLRITSVLRGAADAVLDDSDLEAEFRAMTRAALRKVTADMRIRVKTTPPAKLRFVMQVHPTMVDLTEHAVAVSDRVTEVSTGPWGDEVREYQVGFEVSSVDAPHFEDLLVARIDLVVGEETRADPGSVLVHWTDDPDVPTWVDPRSTHYTAYVDLSQAVDAGLHAYGQGDETAAKAAWGRAVKLAAETGDQKVLDQLQRFVEIVDIDAGEVSLRPGISRYDVQVVKVAVTHTSRYPGDTDPPPPPLSPPGEDTAPPWTCGCGRISPATALFCTQCGRRPPAQG